MGLLEKLKNTFFEEEYVEVEEEEPKRRKKEIKKEEPQVARKVMEVEKIEEKPEKQESFEEVVHEKTVVEPEIQTDTELLKSDNNLPYFEDDDFVDAEEEAYVPPKKEETKKLYGGDPSRIYQNVEFDPASDTKPYSTSKEGKTKFQPTPIISPIYGILDKNYRKEEVVDKKDRPSSYVSRKNVDLDFVRNKAFGSVEEEIDKEEQVEETVPNFVSDNGEYENSLLYDMTDTGTPSVDKVTLADAEEYFEDLGLEYNVDYKDVRYEKATGRRSRITKEEVSDKEEPVKKEKTSKTTEEDEVKLEDNLFDLVDSMYEGKEED